MATGSAATFSPTRGIHFRGRGGREAGGLSILGPNLAFSDSGFILSAGSGRCKWWDGCDASRGQRLLSGVGRQWTRPLMVTLLSGQGQSAGGVADTPGLTHLGKGSKTPVTEPVHQGQENIPCKKNPSAIAQMTDK